MNTACDSEAHSTLFCDCKTPMGQSFKGTSFWAATEVAMLVKELTVPNAVLKIWFLYISLVARRPKISLTNLVLISTLSTLKNQSSLVTSKCLATLLTAHLGIQPYGNTFGKE